MPQVILIGPPGAGKTSGGKALGQRLSAEFADTDALRELSSFNGVLALGGGAVINVEVEEALRDSSDPICFLDVSLASAAPRIGFNRDRPLLLGNPRAKWQELMNVRRPIYEALATLTVSTDSRTPSQIAQEISVFLSKSKEVNS